MRRAAVVIVVVVIAVAVAGCSSLGSVPGFCGVSDRARTAIANVSPSQYPAAAAEHVDELRAEAKKLGGAEGTLALKVADDLEAASKTKAASLEFTDAYNKFVADSNDFDHQYCNVPNDPN